MMNDFPICLFFDNVEKVSPLILAVFWRLGCIAHYNKYKDADNSYQKTVILEENIIDDPKE
jgi:hypothetical protein